MTPEEERAYLVRQLQEIATGMVQEWMRIVDLEDVAGIRHQGRITWQDSDGEFVLGERPGADDYGRFRLRVTVEDLGLLPPIGPENDLGVFGIDDREEPQWVARTWTDVRVGDRVRVPGTEITARVQAIYRAPQEDPVGRTWHVVPSAETGPWAHKTDVVIQPGQLGVLFQDEQPHQAHVLMRNVPVEIELTPAEVAAIELLGWHNRVEQRS